MEMHARRSAGRHGFIGLCYPTIARHSTSLKKLTNSSASLVADVLLKKRIAMASRRGQWFIIAAPTRRLISRLEDINMRENLLVHGVLLKMRLDFE